MLRSNVVDRLEFGAVSASNDREGATHAHAAPFRTDGRQIRKLGPDIVRSPVIRARRIDSDHLVRDHPESAVQFDSDL